MHNACGWLEVTMQDKRVEIGAVGPYDRPKVIIDTNLREEVGVGKRLKHRTA